MRSDIKLYFRGRCSREIFSFGQSNSETSLLQGYKSGTIAGWSTRRGDSESERISQEIKTETSSQQIASTVKESTDRLQAGCYYIQLDNAVMEQQVSNTITTRCDNDTQGVFPINATPDGLARTVKAQYYKTGAANLLRTDGFGATGVLCVDNLKE